MIFELFPFLPSLSLSAGMEPFYNAQASSSSVNIGTKWSVAYDVGSASGTLVTDRVCIDTLCYQSQVHAVYCRSRLIHAY